MNASQNNSKPLRRGLRPILGAIAGSMLLCMCGNSTHDTTEEDIVPFTTEWYDTLTNASAATPELAGMDRDIKRFMDKWKLRGTTFAITRNDSLLYTQGYGWADAEAKTPMEATTVMRIASASKLITAIALMRLVEEGKLSLDSKVFGPDGILSDSVYTDAIADTRVMGLTVDHLLQHLGGFSRPWGDPMFNMAKVVKANRLSDAPSPEELTQIILGRKMAAAPGERRKYSNFGYMLLSLIIEKASGQDYWSYVQENVMEPAGIAGFEKAGNYLSDRLPNEAKYYGPDNVKVEEFNGSGRMVDRTYGGNNITGLLGAGGWLGNAAALARLVAVTDSCTSLRNILSPESTAALTAYDPEANICRGWVEIDDDGNWLRTGTLSSAHVLIKRYTDGECWVMTTNTGVWIGYKFANDMDKLFDSLRAKYSSTLPARNLW